MAASVHDLPHSSYHTSKRPIRRVALACIQCRSRKVKCDATLPSCIRCSADGKTCEYQKSRRGGRPRRPATVPLQVAVEDSSTFVEHETTGQSDDTSGVTTDHHSSSHLSSGSGSGGSSTQSVVDTLESVSHMGSLELGGTCLSRTQIDQLLSQYCVFFHVSHPCVLPR